MSPRAAHPIPMRPTSAPPLLRACALTLCLAWAAAHGQPLPPPAPAATSLAQAWQQAGARDPELAALQAREEAVQAGMALADGLTPGPASVAVDHLSDRFQRDEGRREWEVELGTPLWQPGQRGAQQHAAGQAREALRAQRAQRQLALAGEVRERWWRLAQARAMAALAAQRQDTAAALVGDVQRRLQSGEVARVDLNLAEADRLAAQDEALAARQALQTATQDYTALTGAPPPAQLPAESLTTSPAASPDAPPATDPLATHPQWQALQAAVALAASHLAVLDHSPRAAPELALRWTSQRADAWSPRTQAVGVRLTVPLSSGAQVRQDSAAARAEWLQADGELAQARLQLTQALQAAQTAHALADQQCALARQRAALTAENLRLAQRAYALGEQDLPTLLRARAADHEAQATLARRTLDRDAAVSTLQQARGILPGTQP